MAENARNALRNFSLASKYEFAVEKHVSMSIVLRTPHIDIEWMFTEGRNEPNAELEAALKRNYPFRNASEKLLPRYSLDSDELKRVLGDDAT
jgi:hypothetical protein